MEHLLGELLVFFLTTKVGLAITLGVAYVVSLVLHPLMFCRACRGRPRHRAGIFTYAHGECRRCKGSGAVVRLGARLLPVVSWHPGRRGNR